MKKNINPEVVEIQNRFFEALNLAIELGRFTGLRDFCDKHKLNRIKYSRIRNSIGKPIEEMTYKSIDVDALSAICEDFNVSPEWLLLGRGKMLKSDKTQ